MKERFIIYLAMIIAIPIAGEFKFFPLEGSLRVSLGTPVFFFYLLLWSRKIKPVFAGFVVGMAVFLFRVALLALSSDTSSLEEAIILHSPAFFYYLIYGCLFWLLKVNTRYQAPLVVGLYGVMMEVVSSVVELSLRTITNHDQIAFYSILTIVALAFIRSFFTLGFFNIIILQEVTKTEQELRMRNENMLIHISNLYIEMIQLKKSMSNIEDLTQECYELYRSLRNEDAYSPFSRKALKIAGEVHDIKKDQQRVYAGLSKLMVKEQVSDFMPIEEIINVIISSNNDYRDLLEKDINFYVEIENQHPRYHAYIFLSLVNNLVANAVESIEKKGSIELKFNRENNILIIKVSDNGKGISEKHKNLIFQPGFTTKFDSTGKASNGIGLTYVKDFIESLGGTIYLEDKEISSRTTFTLVLPIDRLNERE